jgi:protease I
MITASSDPDALLVDASNQPARERIAILTTGGLDRDGLSHSRALRGYEIEFITPSGGPLTGHPRAEIVNSIAFTTARVADYALLLLPSGPARRQLRRSAEAVELLRAFGRSGDVCDAVDAGPDLLIKAGQASGAATAAWQEVGPDIKEIAGTCAETPTAEGRAVSRVDTELPGQLIRIGSRVFEQHLPTAPTVPAIHFARALAARA